VIVLFFANRLHTLRCASYVGWARRREYRTCEAKVLMNRWI
jgi:hypothetical protein